MKAITPCTREVWSHKTSSAGSVDGVRCRDATIHILSVSIYHLLCITIQRYIARYSMTDFCRWTEPFFKTMFYTYQTVTEL